MAGSGNSVGSLTAVASTGSLEITSDIISNDNVSLAADTVRIGGANAVSITTLGTNGLGNIDVTNAAGTGQDGTLYINGAVTFNSTTGISSPGAPISLMAVDGDLGSIGTEVGNGDIATSLTITAGGGDVALGSFTDATNLIDSFTVTSGNDINLDAVRIDGNTVDIAVTGMWMLRVRSPIRPVRFRSSRLVARSISG